MPLHWIITLLGLIEIANGSSTLRGDEYNSFTKFYQETSNYESTNCDNSLENSLPRFQQDHIEKFSYYTADKFKAEFSSNLRNLSTLSINIRGIECNYDNFMIYLAELNYDFDVIALTECHLQQNEVYNYDLENTHTIQGYTKFYSRSKIKYGGVILYIKSNLKASYCHELTKSHDHYDSLYVKIDSSTVHDKKSGNRRPLIIGTYYRHCKTTGIIPYINSFDNDLKNKILKKSDVIITGDFNICLMRSTSNNDSLLFLNTIISNNYEIMIFKPTRIQHYKDSLQIKSATLIDQIITNLFQYECKSGNLLYPDSDHFANFMIVESFKSAATVSDIKKIRLTKNIDDDKLTKDFRLLDWNRLVYCEPDLDTAVENLSEALQELCDKHAPLVTPSNRIRKHLNKPWIDSNLLKITKQKNQAFTKKKNVPTALNKAKYEKLNLEVTSLKRKNKKRYFKEYFLRFKNNSKKLWDGINTALEQTKHKKSLPTVIMDVDGITPIEGDKKIADAFAKYFKSVPAKTKTKIPAYKHRFTHYLSKSKAVNDYLVLNDTNIDEVYKQITKLKNGSSPGPCDIPNCFIKKLGLPLAEILTNVINRSMNSGYVPKVMKVGKQTPVHKGGDVCIKNYRPITVCLSIAKILEKIVRDRVIKYIDRVKILNKSQFGFRSKHSTNHAIINLTESTIESLEKELKVGGTYLDIAKAFDCVNHDMLLRKLEYYGFRANTLMWFESYLKNRKQYVNIRQQVSEMYELEWGIPQGGTLAPILFILFINDITNSSDKFDFSIYADDTCLILGIEHSAYNDTMKSELTKVVDWFSSNELLLNFNKTDYLHFGPHHKKVYCKGEHDMRELHEIAPHYILEEPWDEPGDPEPSELNTKGEYVMHELEKVTPQFLMAEGIEMPDGTIINEPDTVKYLGVLFDNKFKFSTHIDILFCKINRIVGILWKSEHLTIEAKKLIYNGLVEAHLNYGIVTWASEFAKNISSNGIRDSVPSSLVKIVKVQNKVLRAIYRKPNYDRKTGNHTSVTALYKDLTVLKLSDLYYFNLAVIAHDYFHGNTLPTKLSDKLCKTRDVSTRVTRSTNNSLHYTTPLSTIAARKPSTAISAYWNFLPVDIKSCKSKTTFKNKLKSHLIDKY